MACIFALLLELAVSGIRTGASWFGAAHAPPTPPRRMARPPGAAAGAGMPMPLRKRRGGRGPLAWAGRPGSVPPPGSGGIV